MVHHSVPMKQTARDEIMMDHTKRGDDERSKYQREPMQPHDFLRNSVDGTCRESAIIHSYAAQAGRPIARQPAKGLPPPWETDRP